MKRKSCLRIVTALFLILAMTLGLVGCPAPDPNGGTSTTTPTGGDPNPPKPTPTDYANPTAIPGTGDALAADAPVLAAPAVNEAGAISKTAQQVTALLRSQGGISDGATYTVTDGKPVTVGAKGRTYDGRGGAIISPAGIVIKDAENCTFENIIFVGPVLLEGSEKITFRGVTFLTADGTALSLDAATTGTVIRDSRIEGKTALDSRADSTYLLDSYVRFAAAGITDAAPAVGIYIRGSRIEGTGTAVALATDNAEIRGSSITVGKADTAVAIGECENLLFAENIVRDAQNAITLTGSYNASLVRNSLISVTVANTKHVSLGDNVIGGKLYASDNGYLLANGNTYPTDSYDHTPVLSGNTNPTGDTLLDVDERLSVGANEKLLPQVDRDRFAYMARKEYVRAPEGDLRISDYIEELAEENAIVIVAPGAYRAYSAITLREEHKNTTVYAYGVFAERVESGATDNDGAPVYHGIYNTRADHVTFKGITLGFAYQAVGQGRVVEIDSKKGTVRIITDAGFPNDLGASNTALYYADTFFGYHAGDMFPYIDVKYNNFVSREADGSLIFRFDLTKSYQRVTFEMIRLGDVMSTRIQNQNFPTVGTWNATGVVYEDLIAYAHSGGVGFGENETDAVRYNRVVDTSAAGKVITKEEYDRYRALEKQYMISFDVTADGDHYRGAPARTGSVDGIHAINTLRGSQVTSSIMENMADDGTNQHGSYSRLSHIVDNGDGTATVVFKGNLTGVAVGKLDDPNAKITPNSWGRFPDEGNKVLLYSLGSGEIICDAVALSNTTSDGTRTTKWNTEVRCYKFTVAADTVNWNAYESFVARGVMDDPADKISADDSHLEDYKIAVENRTYACEDSRFDNCLIQNTRSRGLLFKNSIVRVTNCTFRNMAAAISIRNEGEWGEASFSRDVEIKNNLMEYTGHRGEAPTNSAISICGVGANSRVTLPLDDLRTGEILIEGNVMKNRAAEYAVSLLGVYNVTIRNNDFGSFKKIDMDGLVRQKMTLQIDQCNGITLEGNTYPDPMMANSASVTANRYIGLGGKDIGTAFPDSPNT